MKIINDTDKLIDYEVAIEKMVNFVEIAKTNRNDEIIWLLQHKDIYTIGGSGDLTDILDNSVPIAKTNRGGKITYHGSGQLIVYFILDIRKRFDSDVHKFVDFLEETIIKTLGLYGIIGEKIENMTGVWVENQGKYEKIAAIGIRISNGISYHGMSINISTDLSKFSKIIPCGIKDYGVCSLKSLNIDVIIHEFANRMIDLILISLPNNEI